MYINFWYAAEESANISDKPVKRRMLGQDFVLFRDTAGTVHCLSNTCTHRGGSLGHGTIKGDCIECPYHGWQFSGDGKVHRIPSLGPDAKIPGRTRIDAYPTEERYGLIFCFLGDLPEEERPPIMDIPEWGKEGWQSTLQHYQFDFDYKRSIENGIDPAHNEFVHDTHGFSGNREDYRVPPLEIVETEWGTGFYVEIMAPPLPEKTMAEASGRTEDAVIRAGTGHEGVSSIWTYIHPSEHMHSHQYAFETPIEANRTSIYLINQRNFLPEREHDQRIIDRNEYVVMQDRDVLLGLEPTLTPETNNHELFMPADAPIGRYRDMIKRWQSLGWRIDIDTVGRNHKKVAYAIPSPERRRSKGWVLDTIPLIPAETSDASGRQQVSGE